MADEQGAAIDLWEIMRTAFTQAPSPHARAASRKFSAAEDYESVERLTMGREPRRKVKLGEGAAPIPEELRRRFWKHEWWRTGRRRPARRRRR